MSIETETTPDDDRKPEPPTSGETAKTEQPPPEAEQEPGAPSLPGGRARDAARRAHRAMTKARAEGEPKRPGITVRERLYLLDLWQKSGLPAGDFATLVSVSKHTLYAWKKKFTAEGPAGLEDKPRETAGRGKLPELARRTILMLKQAHPEYGCQRISDLLVRGPGLAASATTVAKVLHDEGYEVEETPTRPHEPPVRRFERAKPNQLWQTDLFTFMLKRQNRRVYLVAFMDDHSRFVVGYGLHASQSTVLTLEVIRAAIASFGSPEEVLTDNGSQYVTWRGKSVFTKELEKRGIRQIVARPRHPQTLGKVERFWGSLWRELLEASTFLDLGDARTRIGLWIDHYNFQRPHQALDGLVPADRYFEASGEVRRSLEARVAENALELARSGMPRKPFYLAGRLGEDAFSVHAEGDRLVLLKEGVREELSLAAPDARDGAAESPGADATPPAPLPIPVCPDGSPAAGASLPSEEPAPGTSPVDELVRPDDDGDDRGACEDDVGIDDGADSGDGGDDDGAAGSVVAGGRS